MGRETTVWIYQATKNEISLEKTWTWQRKRNLNRETESVGRGFANGPGDRGSVPGRVIPKTLKMVLDTSLLNTQQYKVRIKGKVEQPRERSNTLSYTSVL